MSREELRRMMQSPYFWQGFRDGVVMAGVGWSAGFFCGWLVFG